jgi:hypothetical protein
LSPKKFIAERWESDENQGIGDETAFPFSFLGSSSFHSHRHPADKWALRGRIALPVGRGGLAAP